MYVFFEPPYLTIFVPDLVLAKEELVEAGEHLQVLNLSDLVVAQLQHLQLGQAL